MSIAVGEADFLEQVLARSKDVPVLVDFWAPWCAPCRTLGPVLEQLEKEGRFVLAQVDTDASPGLAQRHQIRSIPACKLYREGQIVGEFVGALPPAEIRAFLDRHVPDDATRAARRANDLIAAGDFANAYAALRDVNGDAPLLLVAKARAALLTGHAEEAQTLAERVPTLAEERELADAVDLGAQLARASRDEKGDGVEATYLAAGAHLDRGALLPALDALLEVVRKDRRLRDDAARKLLIALFTVAGVRSETSDTYRRKLADLL